MLKTDDYRRLLAVLEDVEQATSLSGLRRATLDAAAAHLGWEHAAFVTGSSDSPKIEGVAIGLPQRRLDALLARLSREQAMRHLLAAAELDLTGALTRDDLWALLTEGGRAVGDEFLAAQGFRSLLGAWLDAPGADEGPARAVRRLARLHRGRPRARSPSSRRTWRTCSPCRRRATAAVRSSVAAHPARGRDGRSRRRGLQQPHDRPAAERHREHGQEARVGGADQARRRQPHPARARVAGQRGSATATSGHAARRRTDRPPTRQVGLQHRGERLGDALDVALGHARVERERERPAGDVLAAPGTRPGGGRSARGRSS